MGRSASDVASAVGISKQRYHRLESEGLFSTGDGDVIRKVAAELGRNPFEFCDMNAFKLFPETEEERKSAIAYLSSLGE